MLFDGYLWLKGLHVASVLLFIGGLIAETAFMAALPEAQTLASGQRHAASIFRAWDRRLTSPAMVLAWGSGLTLALMQGWFSSHWLHAKLVFVLVLSALHGVQSGSLRRLTEGAGRMRVQTVPILIIIISATSIAVLAVVKPF